MKLIITSVFCFCAFFPSLMLVTEYGGLNDDYGAVASILISWIFLPYIILRVWSNKPSLECLPVKNDDPIMREYIDVSLSEIQRFISGLQDGVDEAYIKFSHAFDGEIEYVWGVAHSIIDGNLVVASIISNPVGELNDEDYARIKIPISDIHDWMLVNHKGEVSGGYSHLAMIKIYERDYGKVSKKHINSLENFIDLKEMI